MNPGCLSRGKIVFKKTNLIVSLIESQFSRQDSVVVLLSLAVGVVVVYLVVDSVRNDGAVIAGLRAVAVVNRVVRLELEELWKSDIDKSDSILMTKRSESNTHIL